MEQIRLSAILWHVQASQGIWPSQCRFVKVRSYLTNLISFHDKVARLADAGKVGLDQKSCGQKDQGSDYTPVPQLW